MRICVYNRQVDCMGEVHCYRCGWNPKVAEERAKKVRARLKREEEKKHAGKRPRIRNTAAC